MPGDQMNLRGGAPEIKRQEHHCRDADGHPPPLPRPPPHISPLITAGGLHKPTACKGNMQTTHMPVLEG